MSKIIIFFVILILIFSYLDVKSYEPFKLNVIEKVCKRLHVDDDNKKYMVMKNLMTKEFCKRLIISGEKYAKQYKWTKSRHNNYPTTDNEVTESWKEYKEFRSGI